MHKAALPVGSAIVAGVAVADATAGDIVPCATALKA
jgi:hypothetical protein